MQENIIVINSGSSSLKFKVFKSNEETEIISGICERIGIDGVFNYKLNNVSKEEKVNFVNHLDAVKYVMNFLKTNKIINDIKEISGIGHRVVHGGVYFKEAVKLDAKSVDLIEKCIPLAPLHNPGAISGIKAFMEIAPHAKNVACFDTSFHQTMPESSYLYAVPKNWFEEHNVRRYGFHGISYEYIVKTAEKEILKKKKPNLIVCHLGNGASICAIKDGKSYATTMGMTPLAGLVMGTRSGDIDASIIQYITQVTGKSLNEVMKSLQSESGLKGLCGSSDLRDIEAQSIAGNKESTMALTLWSQRIADYICTYANYLENKVDAIIFTAGIGENSKTISLILEKIKIINIAFSKELLATKYESIQQISTTSSQIPIFRVRTDEELMIFKTTKSII